MTIDVERFAFLLLQLPACTQSPVKVVLGSDLHRELRAKYKLELGLDLMDDKCGNIFNCILQGSGCIGRPMPLDDQIFKALKASNCEVTTGNHKGREVYLAKSITCGDCPFNVNCDSPCATQESYLKRSIRSDQSPREPMLVSFDDYEEGKLGLLAYTLPPETEVTEMDYSWMNETLPMDCLSPKQRQVIEMIRFKDLTQVETAGRLGIDQSVVSRQLKLAEDRLREFALARKILKNKLDKRAVLYYIDNKSQEEIAEMECVKQNTISEHLTKWRLDSGLQEIPESYD
jgi:RNA polymerase sigma factor (sigma-70 family)